MSEVIVFTSGKGGVGKTNLCLNTALQLTALQYRTCLFDGDLGLANVNILLGIDQEYTLDDVVFKDKSIDEILVQTGYGFDIIPGSSGVEQIANLSSDQLESLISALTGVDAYDYFLIDTASGISRSVISFCMAARQTVIVITREATSLTDAYALLKILSVNGYQGSVRVLVNNCESIPQAKSTYLRYKKVVDRHLDIAISPAGIVLHDEHFERAVVQQKPLLEIYPESIGGQCIKAFVANLVGEEGPQGEKEGLSQFWQRYLKQITADDPSGRSQKDSTARIEEKQSQPGSVPIPGASLPAASDFGVGHEVGVSLFRSASYLEGASSCPVFLGAIFKRLNRGDISSGELRQLIAVDPALMLQTLRLLPLQEIAPQGHIQNLDQLIASLNNEDIQPMLLQAAVRSAGASPEDSPDRNDLQKWLCSYRCAVLARKIGQAVSFAFPDEAYMAGLLLDIGRSGADSDENHGGSADHAAVGADLLQALGLNSMICDAVRFHHHPPSQVSTAFSLVRIVYTAHALINGTEFEEEVDLFSDIIDLPEEEVGDLLEQSLEVTSRTASVLDLDISEAAAAEAAADRNGSLSGYLLDILLTRTIMPPLKSQASNHDWARQFHRSCKLLAGIGNIICFVADVDGKNLTAVGFDGCACGDQIDSLVITLDNATSMLSKSFTTGSPVTWDLADESTVNLGDRQLGRLLGGKTMICAPLKTGGNTLGLVVCSTDNGPEAVGRQVGILLTVGARAAEDLAGTS